MTTFDPTGTLELEEAYLTELSLDRIEQRLADASTKLSEMINDLKSDTK